MGFLDQFKKNRDADIHNDWKVISSDAELQSAIDASFEKPVMLFKHSVTCGISAGAKFGLEREWDFKEEELSFYYLDLLSYRPISNKIADDLGVTHQSPQVILVKNGKAVYDTSHHAISVNAIRNALSSNA